MHQQLFRAVLIEAVKGTIHRAAVAERATRRWRAGELADRHATEPAFSRSRRLQWRELVTAASRKLELVTVIERAKRRDGSSLRPSHPLQRILC
jgi:hypothetical protein